MPQSRKLLQWLATADLSKPAATASFRRSPSKQLILPNTSGARNAAEAVRLAEIARAAGLEPWVKLELTPEPKYLLPDPIETLVAAEKLVKAGFGVAVHPG